MKTYKLAPRRFLVLATQNPLEQEGNLPAARGAKIDRFMIEGDRHLTQNRRRRRRAILDCHGHDRSHGSFPDSVVERRAQILRGAPILSSIRCTSMTRYAITSWIWCSQPVPPDRWHP